MTDPGPTRGGSDLADVVEMLLDKGVVINADIAVSIGDTQLLGVHLRAAIASFETAAQYGLAFPEGTDTERIEQVADMSQRSLHPADDENGDAAPDDRARHERRAVALRPTADRPGGVGGVDAEVVDLDADADGKSGDVRADDDAADDDATDDDETAGGEEETADGEASADQDETTDDERTTDDESEEGES